MLLQNDSHPFGFLRSQHAQFEAQESVHQQKRDTRKNFSGVHAAVRSVTGTTLDKLHDDAQEAQSVLLNQIEARVRFFLGQSDDIGGRFFEINLSRIIVGKDVQIWGLLPGDPTIRFQSYLSMSSLATIPEMLWQSKSF